MVVGGTAEEGVIAGIEEEEGEEATMKTVGVGTGVVGVTDEVRCVCVCAWIVCDGMRCGGA